MAIGNQKLQIMHTNPHLNSLVDKIEYDRRFNDWEMIKNNYKYNIGCLLKV